MSSRIEEPPTTSAAFVVTPLIGGGAVDAAKTTTTTTTTTTVSEDALLALFRTESEYYPPRRGGPPDLERCGYATFRSAAATSAEAFARREEAHRRQTSEWRSRIADWCYRVVDHFQYDREAVSSSLAVLDLYVAALKEDEEEALALARARALAAPQDGDDDDDDDTTRDYSCRGCAAGDRECGVAIDARTYYLAAMASLYVTLKMRGASSLQSASSDGDPHRTSAAHRLRLRTFVDLSNGQFEAEDITRMELRLLEKLRWRVNPPTAAGFVPALLDLIPEDPLDDHRAEAAVDDGDVVMWPQQELPQQQRGQQQQRAPVIDPQIRAAARRRRSFTLHVAREIARYLTELAACSSPPPPPPPPPSASAASILPLPAASPSEVSYAAILVALEGISPRVLSPRVRRSFFVDAARLSGGALTYSSAARAMAWLRGLMDPRQLLGSAVFAEGAPREGQEGGATEGGGGDMLSQAVRAGVLDPVALCRGVPVVPEEEYSEEEEEEEEKDRFEDGRGVGARSSSPPPSRRQHQGVSPPQEDSSSSSSHHSGGSMTGRHGSATSVIEQEARLRQREEIHRAQGHGDGDRRHHHRASKRKGVDAGECDCNDDSSSCSSSYVYDDDISPKCVSRRRAVVVVTPVEGGRDGAGNRTARGVEVEISSTAEKGGGTRNHHHGHHHRRGGGGRRLSAGAAFCGSFGYN
uniref:Cyclin N-terminal domain-containing protein n=1 Tax=Odontella aurita TaxID=265563 RepID=A0A6U6H8D4_9STRA|mmetsp:Transcript_4591/g.12877  ORF Transcript_4591/g.12877 Transcript_4591/m.12877 type:complete len:696 (+) Transcript_4591:966-3053(+)